MEGKPLQESSIHHGAFKSTMLEICSLANIPVIPFAKSPAGPESYPLLRVAMELETSQRVETMDLSQVVVSTTGGSATYDSVTVSASDDGSFTAKVRGDCASPNTSVSVSVAEQVSGTKTTSVTKTALCTGGSGGETEDSVFAEIAGSDGAVSLSEVLSYISGKGGLSAIVTSGGSKLAGVIKAAKSALGLS